MPPLSTDAVSASGRKGRHSDNPHATTRPSTAKIAKAGSENPISIRIGSVAALNAAHPITGAAPSASARGNRWRDMA